MAVNTITNKNIVSKEIIKFHVVCSFKHKNNDSKFFLFVLFFLRSRKQRREKFWKDLKF